MARSILKEHPIHIHNGLCSTDYHTLYNIDSELTLSQPDIELGAIAALPQTDNPTFAVLRQAYGDSLAVNWLCIHISMLNASSGASNRMDAVAMALCAKDIMAAFPYLTLGEFCVFCTRMRSLRYARKRSDYVFSSDTIMLGLREFLSERKQELDRYEREHTTQPDYSRCVPWEVARQTEEYKAGFKEETEGKHTLPKKSALAHLKDFAHAFRPTKKAMSEEEFVKLRDAQLKAYKERYL